ncbi:unnamed protein product [Alopecurus aequalis]
MTWFPKLWSLKIIDCPKLSSLAPIPWNPAPCSAQIEGTGCGFQKLIYTRSNGAELCLKIKGKGGENGMLWNGLDFHNLADLGQLEMENCPPLLSIHLHKLKSFKTLKIRSMSTVLVSEGESHSSTGCSLPVERIEIQDCDANGEELTQLLSHFLSLRELSIHSCGKITELGVVAVPAASSPSSSDNNILEHAHAGLLLLPPQLQDLNIWKCDELRLLSDSLGDDNVRDGLQRLCSLRSLVIIYCPKFLSSYYFPSASPCFPFSVSLQQLYLGDMEGMETLACLSNIISLTELVVWRCPDLRGEGLWPLVAQGRLAELRIAKTPKFFTGLELFLPHDQERPSHSSKLKYLETDDLAGVFTMPVCSLLSPSLTKLAFISDKEVERFTEEQEEALHLLSSLQELAFVICKKLQSIPTGLTKLTNLKRLQIRVCSDIQLLDGLPSSLQELVIARCPAIKSLPKDGLPSSLLKLQVYGVSEDLKSQCRKFKGTIPIIMDSDS